MGKKTSSLKYLVILKLSAQKVDCVLSEPHHH